MSLIKKLALYFGLFFFLLFVIAYFGVQNPAGGCPEFFGIGKPVVSYEEYEKLNLESCGDEQRGDENNLKLIQECLQDALTNCEQKKAFVRIVGFESTTRYVIQTTKDCEVKIKGGSCGITTKYCETMPEIKFGYVDCE